MNTVIMYQKMRDAAVTLRTEGLTMRDTVEEADRIMQRIDSGSESEALSELAARFHAFRSGSMENCMKLLDNMAVFLENAAQRYETADSAMRSDVAGGIGNKAAFLN